MDYDFRKIEKAWQEKWNETQAYKTTNDTSKPKCYVLDMFPYPSGAGLHVGHPLGYISSDIYSRYKRLKGFNVLHPMGYDAFGLPAEQYAIEKGVHPAVSTEENIENFRKQLDNIGFSYDWDREVRTSDPSYYKWTQWIFLQLFESFFNRIDNRAEHLSVLIESFENEGSIVHKIPNEKFQIEGCAKNSFTADEWNHFDEKTKQDILMEYRLAFCGYGEVNWCEALGTVLANDEVVNGVSERGGYPVEKKRLRQWYLRITEYADRLLKGLESVDFSEAMKEMQSNWIGKSYGAEIDFKLKAESDKLQAVPQLTVYTTRPDTIFGVDFMVIAPELDWISSVVSAAQKEEVENYIAYVKSRSERERQAEKKISGCFTGAYAINPFNGKEIPIWISEYVLAGYGTGAIMAVPCGDDRDFRFAQHFNIPITNILGDAFDGMEANSTKDAILFNSGFLNGIVMRDAIQIVNSKLEEMGIGKPKVNYRMRDAAFSRQRYWGEPFPIVWKNGIAYPLAETELPLELPKVDKYGPGPDGEGPLANIPEWVAKELETNTMPGYAGSSWYFLRYMDPHNDQAFCDRKASDYWNQVDIYIGGTEHAVGHLLYSRLWTKVLYDLGFIGFDEPFKKLVNQGMIQGSSRFVYRIGYSSNYEFPPILISKSYFDSYSLEETSKIIKKGIEEYWRKINGLDITEFDDGTPFTPMEIEPLSFEISKDATPFRVKVDIVDGFELDTEAFRQSKAEFANAIFILENGKYICGSEVEKMSKSKLNSVSPYIPSIIDDEGNVLQKEGGLVAQFGADTFRMYEMFLGPVEASKPWDTKGIEGVHRFLKKLWRLFFSDTTFSNGQAITGKPVWNDKPATPDELKVLHKTIRKIDDDTEKFSYNTAVSAFMVCVNELTDLKCNKKSVLEQLLILLSPYAPHITEELWHQLGNISSILDAAYPVFESKYTVESSKEYPVSINGKLRTTMDFDLDALEADVKSGVLTNELVQKWLEGKEPKKIVFVKGKMINVVV